MFCQNCGCRLDNTEKFCPDCGAPVAGTAEQQTAAAQTPEQTEKPAKKRKPAAETMMHQGRKVTENIYFCEDGIYRWIYEMPILKNPTIFILVWKIFFFVTLGIFVFIILIDAIGGDLDGETFLNTLKFFGYFVAGMTALVVLSLLVYAAVMGGKYIVMFEMDEKGVNHKQMPRQVKKAEVIGILTVLAGLASRNITTVGVGLNSTARSEMYSEFSKVRSVKPFPRRDLIKVNAPFSKNQVYAAKEDYAFVVNYICQRVPDSAKPKA